MDFVALSHLRWDFVYQRPQHLLSRCSREHRVFFWEEPEYRDGIEPHVKVSEREYKLLVAVPQLPTGIAQEANFACQAKMLDEMMSAHSIQEFVLWYYTPMAMNFTRHLEAAAVVYDCMDELSAFRGAPPGLRSAERELFARADLVFTGGQSLYESKRSQHPAVHLFPSSIDAKHFASARSPQPDPADQCSIPRPRIGYCGVIDERMDVDLLAQSAELRPEFQFVMVGPIVKISEDDLPRRSNIHYLGGKKYSELPSYMAGWDVGMLPFARNESTRFISPTKTPEYLAAGLPVVSTPITDVVRPYGELGLVSIADDAYEFTSAVDALLRPRSAVEERQRLQTVDLFLARSSWDQTWRRMRHLVMEAASTAYRKSNVARTTTESIAGSSASAD